MFLARVMAAIVLSLALAAPCMAGSWGAFNFGQNVYGHFKSLIGWVDLVPSPNWSTNAWEAGSTNIGASIKGTLTLSNSGNDILEDVTIETKTGPTFRQYSSMVLGNISSGRNKTIKVAYSPTSAVFSNGSTCYSAPNIARICVALSGTGVGTVSYTTYFSALSQASPCGDTTDATTVAACADPTAWTSFTDTASKLTLSSGKLVTAISASNTAASLSKTGLTTGKYDVQAKVDISLANITGFTNGGNFQFVSIRGTSLVGASVAARANGATSLNSFRLAYLRGDNVSTTIDVNYTLVAGHTYTVRMPFLLSSANANDTVKDGSIALYVSDNGAAETEVLTPTAISTRLDRAAGITRYDSGFVYISTALTETSTISKVLLGYK